MYFFFLSLSKLEAGSAGTAYNEDYINTVIDGIFCIFRQYICIWKLKFYIFSFLPFTYNTSVPANIQRVFDSGCQCNSRFRMYIYTASTHGKHGKRSCTD